MAPLRFVFTVQGEGRGHLTQAIAAYELLTAQGHLVSAVLVGSSSRREIPAFVRRRINTPIHIFASPNFITDEQNKAIQVGKSIWHTLFHVSRYWKSMQFIRQIVAAEEPDILLNFFEPLTGLCNLLYRIPAPVVSIAHQYIYLHPQFRFPKDASQSDKWAIRTFTRITAIGSKSLLALSFYPLEQQRYNRIIICPPLLRKEISQIQTFAGNHILLYLVNAGYMQEVIEWHLQHPEVVLHCFTDSTGVKGKWQYSEHLHFHSLDDQKFLRFMANSKAVVTTAGFESVCEAMYMGKPVMMVPVAGHFEQWCNAHEGVKAGAGTFAFRFDLNVLLQYLPHHSSIQAPFCEWADQGATLLTETIEAVGYCQKKPEPANSNSNTFTLTSKAAAITAFSQREAL